MLGQPLSRGVCELCGIGLANGNNDEVKILEVGEGIFDLSCLFVRLAVAASEGLLEDDFLHPGQKSLKSVGTVLGCF